MSLEAGLPMVLVPSEGRSHLTADEQATQDAIVQFHIQQTDRQAAAATAVALGGDGDAVELGRVNSVRIDDDAPADPTSAHYVTIHPSAGDIPLAPRRHSFDGFDDPKAPPRHGSHRVSFAGPNPLYDALGARRSEIHLSSLRAAATASEQPEEPVNWERIEEERGHGRWKSVPPAPGRGHVSCPPVKYTLPIPVSTLSPQVWRAVPKDVLSIIARSLDAQSLCALAGVDTQSRSVADDKKLWNILAYRPWVYRLPPGAPPSRLSALPTPSGGDASGLSVSRNYRAAGGGRGGGSKQSEVSGYQAEYNGVRRAVDPKGWMRERRRTALDRYHELEQMMVQQALNRESNGRAAVVHFFFDSLEFPLVAGMLVIMMGLLVKQLADGDSCVTVRGSLWPILLIVAYLVVSSLLHIFKRHTAWGQQTGILPSTYASDTSSFVAWFLSLATHINDDPRDRWRPPLGVDFALVTFVTMFWAVLLSFVLIVLRCGGVITWDWLLVFLPFYVAVLFYFLSPCFQWSIHHGDSRAFYAILIVLVPVFIFSVLLPVYLEEGRGPGNFTLAKVFVPLFILDGLFMCVSCYGGALLILWGDEDADDIECAQCCVASFVGTLTWSTMFSPFIVFKILLALRIDSQADLAWPVVFIPMYVTGSIILAGAVYLAQGIHQDRKWKAAAKPTWQWRLDVPPI
jgi:hypothetical protein